ncbi:MAG: hypothetical protein WCY24_06100 [Lutispora sp.]|nr:hypothetical protein [Lutispora sp.]MDD4835296.1 hypothetical protein [Lutispora sp.]
MKAYLISYDISRNSKKVYSLYKVIKGCSHEDYWVQCFNNLWIIKSKFDSNTIYERIKEVLDSNDCFLVVEITQNCDGWLDTNIWDYIGNNIFRQAKTSPEI